MVKIPDESVSLVYDLPSYDNVIKVSHKGETLSITILILFLIVIVMSIHHTTHKQYYLSSRMLSII